MFHFHTAVAFIIAFVGLSFSIQSPAFAADVTTTIVFIPGFKGSILADEDDDEVWITPSHALFNRTSVALQIPDLDLPSARKLHPTEVLKNITVIPGLYEFDAYGRFLSELKSHVAGCTEIEEVPYDWRRGIDFASALLFERVDKLRALGRKRIILVGHSMGGLVTSYFLRYGGQPHATAQEDWSGAALVDGAVIAGVPFQGALKMYCDMLVGTKTGRNSSLLSVDSLGSFASSYSLLPRFPVTVHPPPCAGGKSHLDVEFWSSCNLGMLNSEIEGEVRDRRLKFMREQLENARMIFELFMSPSTSTPSRKISLENFIGVGKATIKAAHYIEGKREPPSCSSEYSTADGDDIVLATSARMPVGFSNGLNVHETEISGMHEELLSDPKVLAAVLQLEAAPD